MHVEHAISLDQLLQRAMMVKDEYGAPLVKTLMTKLFGCEKLMDIRADNIPQAYHLFDHISQLTGEQMTLAENVEMLLYKCPHTVWDTTGERNGRAGVADLGGSLMLTFSTMAELIAEQTKPAQPRKLDPNDYDDWLRKGAQLYAEHKGGLTGLCAWHDWSIGMEETPHFGQDISHLLVCWTSFKGGTPATVAAEDPTYELHAKIAGLEQLIEQQLKQIEDGNTKNDHLLNRLVKYESAAGVERVLKGTTSVSLTITPELEAELVKALSGQTSLMIVAPDHPKTFEEAWARFEAAGYSYGGGALENVRFGWQIAHGLTPKRGAADLAAVNAARAMLAPGQLEPVKVAACAECSVAVETLEGVEHYNMGCDACARRFDGDDSARIIKHVEPVAMPAVKLRGKAFPDECVATGQTCSYGPHGRNGERQCEYCGSAPSAYPQIERTTQEFPLVELCPGCGIPERAGGHEHYTLDCEACQVRQAAQEARAQGTPIHDLGDDVAKLIDALIAHEWSGDTAVTELGKKLEAAMKELLNGKPARSSKDDAPLLNDVVAVVQMLIDGEWAEHCTKSPHGRELEYVITKLHSDLNDAQEDSARLNALEARIKERGAAGVTFFHDAAYGGTFTYMHRHYRSAARQNLREVIDFERGIMPTLPEFKEPK